MEGTGTEQRVRAPVGMSDESSGGENTGTKGRKAGMSRRSPKPWGNTEIK